MNLSSLIAIFCLVFITVFPALHAQQEGEFVPVPGPKEIDFSDPVQIQQRLEDIKKDLRKIEKDSQTYVFLSEKQLRAQEILRKLTEKSLELASSANVALRACKSTKSAFLGARINSQNDPELIRLAQRKFSSCISDAGVSIDLGIAIQKQTTVWLETSIKTASRAELFAALTEANKKLGETLQLEQETLEILLQGASFFNELEELNRRTDNE